MLKWKFEDEIMVEDTNISLLGSIFWIFNLLLGSIFEKNVDYWVYF